MPSRSLEFNKPPSFSVNHAPDKCIFRIKVVPSDSASGDWLLRMGKGSGIQGIEKAHRETDIKMLKMDKDNKEYTLWADPTRIKHTACDREFYNAEVINFLQGKKNSTFTIVADKDPAVKEVIKRIGEEQRSNKAYRGRTMETLS